MNESKVLIDFYLSEYRTFDWDWIKTANNEWVAKFSSNDVIMSRVPGGFYHPILFGELIDDFDIWALSRKSTEEDELPFDDMTSVAVGSMTTADHTAPRFVQTTVDIIKDFVKRKEPHGILIDPGDLRSEILSAQRVQRTLSNYDRYQIHDRSHRNAFLLIEKHVAYELMREGYKFFNVNKPID